MDPENLRLIPDLSWLEPMAHEAMNLFREAMSELPKAYWAGYQNGWVHATLALLATWCLSKR